MHKRTCRSQVISLEALNWNLELVGQAPQGRVSGWRIMFGAGGPLKLCPGACVIPQAAFAATTTPHHQHRPSPTARSEADFKPAYLVLRTQHDNTRARNSFHSTTPQRSYSHLSQLPVPLLKPGALRSPHRAKPTAWPRRHTNALPWFVAMPATFS